MTFCGNCGSNNPAGNHFCYSCGAELPIGGATQPVMQQPPMQQQGPIDNKPVLTPPQAQKPKEVEYIGGYNPNANYKFKPMQQPPIMPYSQAVNQNPNAPNGYQMPPMQGQAPNQGYATAGAMYGYQNQYGNQNPYGNQNQYGNQQAPPEWQEYDQQQQQMPMGDTTKFRYIGIALAFVTLVITMVAIFAVPTDFSTMSYTLWQIASEDTTGTIMIFIGIILAFGIVSVLIPLFSVVSAVTIALTGVICWIDSYIPDVTSLLVLVVVALVITLVGFFASMMMKQYVKGRIAGISLFKCCLFTWRGLPQF